MVQSELFGWCLTILMRKCRNEKQNENTNQQQSYYISCNETLRTKFKTFSLYKRDFDFGRLVGLLAKALIASAMVCVFFSFNLLQESKGIGSGINYVNYN